MKFLLDHDVPDDISHLLRYWGHEVTLLRDVLEITTSDKKIFGYVCQHRLMIISCNRNHFLALAGQSMSHPGLIVLIRRRTRQMECARLLALLRKAGESGLVSNVNFA